MEIDCFIDTLQYHTMLSAPLVYCRPIVYFDLSCYFVHSGATTLPPLSLNELQDSCVKRVRSFHVVLASQLYVGVILGYYG